MLGRHGKGLYWLVTAVLFVVLCVGSSAEAAGVNAEPGAKTVPELVVAGAIKVMSERRVVYELADPVYGPDVDPWVFDCSAFAQYVYREFAGINIPRTTEEQLGPVVDDALRDPGVFSDPESLQPGDLVFLFTNVGPRPGDEVQRVAQHVGIYIGKPGEGKAGKFIHCSSSAAQATQDLTNPFTGETVSISFAQPTCLKVVSIKEYLGYKPGVFEFIRGRRVTSSYGGIVAPTPVLARPANFSATAMSSDKVKLTWRYPSAGGSKESGFRIQRREGSGSYVQIAEMKNEPSVYGKLRTEGMADAFEWLDGDVETGKRYEYRIYAYDASHPGPEDANTSNSDAAVVLAPPHNVKAQHVNTIQEDGRQKFHVRVAWDYESGAQDGFKIERWVAEENDFRQKTTTVTADEFEVILTETEPGTVSRYRVRAYNTGESTGTDADDNHSSYSAEVSAELPATQSPPTVTAPAGSDPTSAFTPDFWPEAWNTDVRRAYQQHYLQFERSKTPISWATFCEYSRPFAPKTGIGWNDEEAWSAKGLADTPEFIGYARKNPISLIARCLFAENRNITGDVGQRAVRATAEVISNRVRVAWGRQNTLSGVILASGQFSCMWDENTGARNPVLLKNDDQLALWCYCVYVADHLYSGTSPELWSENGKDYFYMYDIVTGKMLFSIGGWEKGTVCTEYNVEKATHRFADGMDQIIIARPIKIGPVVFHTYTDEPNAKGWWEREQTPAKPPASVLSKPTNFSARAISSTEVELRWIYPSSGTSKESGFRLQRREEGGTYQQISEMRKNDPADPNVYERLRVPGAADSFQWVDRGVVAGKRYEYRVYAYDATHPGPEDANTSNIDAAVVLAPPYNVKAQHVNTIQEDGRQKFHVRITWDYESGTQDGFKIERWVPEENDFRQKTTTVTANEFEVILTETEPRTVGRYRVRAYNTGESTGTDADDNHSSYSGEASAVLPDTQSQATGDAPSDSGSTESKPQTPPEVQPAPPAAAGTSASLAVVDSETPLMKAAHNTNNPELIKVLAAAGANVNTRLKDGGTALMIAIEFPYADRMAVIKALIEAGADVNAGYNDGTTPLMRAARTNNPELIKVLAAAGANVNARLEDGSTALVIAINDPYYDRPKVVNALIEAGANVNVGFSDGGTPLMLAAQLNRLEVVMMLIEAGANVNAGDNDGRTPLMRAAQNTNNPELIKLLAAAGADVNRRLKDGSTALMIAIEFPYADRMAVIKALIEAGADVNAGYNDGTTPLMRAARTNNPELIKVLAAAGANVNARLEDGSTALVIAINDPYYDRPKVVNALIEAGANVNVGFSDGGTPLMLAAQLNRLEVVMMLIEAGADINAR